MPATLVNKRQLRREVEAAARDAGNWAAGARTVVADLAEALEAQHLRPDQFSIRDLTEALVEDGREYLDAIHPGRKSGGMDLAEAANAVDTSALSNITGQIVFSRVKEGYNAPEFIDEELCETQQTDFLDGEKIPGIGEIGDQAEVVGEAMPYPDVGVNEEWLQTVPTVKRGFVVPVTREIAVYDRTGLLMRRCSDTGKWLRVNKQKRVIDCAVGVTNNYNRNGVASNTYLTAGAYVNALTGNALDVSGNEWRALEKLELLFDAITDPNTGEPVVFAPNTLLVPTSLKRSVNRILTATEVTTADMRANAATVRTTGPNPYAGGGLRVVSSPYVKLRTGSATKWFFGDFKRAIAYMQVWAIETDQLMNNSEAAFRRDIIAQYKVSERGAAQVMEPRFVASSDA